MSMLGLIGFTQPALLWALAALPLIWWLLRFTPPRPRRTLFPPLRLLLGLGNKEETPAKSPWWLTALRISLATILIVALAGPLLNPRPVDRQGGGPLVLLIDNSWAAGSDWEERRQAARDEIELARARDVPVILAPLATAGAAAVVTPVEPRRAVELLDALTPFPFAPDRLAALARVKQAAKDFTNSRVVWITDGLNHGGDRDEFLKGLRDLAPGATPIVYTHDIRRAPIGLGVAVHAPDGLDIPIKRAASGVPLSGLVRAVSLNGRSLAESRFEFASDHVEANAHIDLPLELRNEIVRIELVDGRTAGGVRLLDDRWRRKRVGLVTGESRDIAQPLLSPLYYVERALSPYADINRQAGLTLNENIDSMMEQRVGMIIMTDVGQIGDEARTSLGSWLENGGILVRFAGPRLAASADDLVPVRLRQGGRVLGGSLSWTEAQPLRPFEDDTPFVGLPVPRDILVRQQVLAEPNSGLAGKTWAQLADGTPLVTAEKRGNGWLILFHVTANSSWSNLPLSGLFVTMLQRILDFAPATGVTNTDNAAPTGGSFALADQTLPPFSILNGQGQLGSPPITAQPLAVDAAEEVRPSAIHPPGLYGQPTSFRALNILNRNDTLVPLALENEGFSILPFEQPKPIPIKPWLLTAAFVLLLLDTIAVLALSGRPLGLPRRGVAAAAAGIIAIGLSMSDARAQLSAADQFAMDAANHTRLAYVFTGNPDIDAISEAGLRGLSLVIKERTALEPDTPMGVDIARDELAFFPLLYWPVDPNAKQPPAAVLARIDAYMKQGGTILFDTRDQAIGAATLGSGGAGTLALRRLLAGVDIPALEPVPADHVLTKAFYLLQDFPGRWEGGKMWVEASVREDTDQPRPARNSDGVSSVIITSNDLAAAWAMDENRRPMLPVTGGEWQRELAFRSGINIVMYTLTGNYKADQVHIPALLERLGQ